MLIVWQLFYLLTIFYQVAFLMTFLPPVVIITIVLFAPEKILLNSMHYNIIHWVLLAGSCINPLICAFLSKKFRGSIHFYSSRTWAIIPAHAPLLRTSYVQSKKLSSGILTRLSNKQLRDPLAAINDFPLIVSILIDTLVLSTGLQVYNGYTLCV